MTVSGGTVIIVLVLGLCAVAALFFAVKSYIRLRQGITVEPQNAPQDRPSGEGKETHRKSPPSSG